MKKFIKAAGYVIFGIYIILLLYLTLFWSIRSAWSNLSILEYAKSRSNFIPFKSIAMYIKMYKYGNSSVPIVNLVGNFLMFVPMGAFLPMLFKKLHNFFASMGVTFLFLAIIEVTQILTRRGSFDIDDLILNMLGAVVGFLIQLIIRVVTNNSKNNFIEGRVETEDENIV